MIADKNSRRSKGIAYIEFHDEKSVMPVSGYVSECCDDFCYMCILCGSTNGIPKMFYHSWF